MPGVTLRMKVVKAKFHTEFQGIDDQGPYRVEVQNDCSQLRFKTGNDEGFIDTNEKELTKIRDVINYVLERHEKKRAKR